MRSRKCKSCRGGLKKRNKLYCSMECRSSDKDYWNKIAITNMSRYGATNPFQSEKIKHKIRLSTKLKYGVDNPAQNENIKKKMLATNNILYGHNSPLQNTTIKEKRRNNFSKKYGVDNPTQLNSIKEKIKTTNIKRYGTTCSLLNATVKEKTTKTSIRKYGTKIPIQSPKIKEKVRKTNIDRYGIDCIFKTEKNRKLVKTHILKKYNGKWISQLHIDQKVLDKLNSAKWLIKQYTIKNKTTEEIGHEIGVDSWTVCNYLHKFDIPITRLQRASKIASRWLTHIRNTQKIEIIPEFNIPETMYYADGYCPDNNTIYEFYGDCFHGNLNTYKETDQCHPFNREITALELYNRTIERETKIKSLGYNIVTIWESQAKAILGKYTGTN